ncbi:MAG: response regulator [Deltaproteobacteria bacterium]|nr:response regulator [Deltaproteobacteria bacterium]MBW2072811.1 response regulator [Deltaproteobacteria bacterium]
MAHKVLVVDDEAQVRDILSRFLAVQGYEPITASSGDEAIALVKNESPAVILLDITMPGTDGIETCQRLREMETTRLVPIIVATAHPDCVPEALLVGADDFVDKPFDFKELSLRLETALQIAHLADETERAMLYTQLLGESLH